MTASFRPCRGSADFPLITNFLTTLYQADNSDGNWFAAVWEYAYTHAWFDDRSAGRIGIWEDKGRIVAVASYELRPGEAFFNAHPDYAHLKADMLNHAQHQLAAATRDGLRHLRIFVNDFDTDLEQLVRRQGYQRAAQFDRPMSRYTITWPFPHARLPQGFHLRSLAEDNNPQKLRRIFHRGFNHPGPVPKNDLAGVQKMQSGPHHRKDLYIVVVAPNGDFVSIAGLWYDADNRFAYVEPVATDPDFRRRGLARAAVMEGIHRCAQEDATVAYVASTQPFYQSLGFTHLYTCNCWIKDLPPD